MNRFIEYDVHKKKLTPISGYLSVALVSLEQSLESIVPRPNEIDRSIKEAKSYCHFPSEHGLTHDESAALFLYTMEGGENSFYRALNHILREEDRSKIRPWFAYLKLFDTALSKLPTVKKCVWRGVPSDVSNDYEVNELLTWWNVSSCSSSINVVTDVSKSVNNFTLFMIEAIHGKNLAGYTLYSDENEIVLGVGTKLRVKRNALTHCNLPVVHLIEVDDDTHAQLFTPLVSMGTMPKLRNNRVPVLRNVTPDATWTPNAYTVAGGFGRGNAVNQLDGPYGLYVDEDQTVIIADCCNHRIVELKWGAGSGQVVAGGNGQGNRADQLNGPVDVIVDKETNCLIISDRNNRRVVRWSRQSGTTSGNTIISNVMCWGLMMDDQKCLYVSDTENHVVRRYSFGETIGTVVAGGHERGDQLNQLNDPTFLFVDRDQSVYISDNWNHRVIKWVKDAKEGIIVADSRGEKDHRIQLQHPRGVFVDQIGTVYVADLVNNRVMRFRNGVTHGDVVVGDNGKGERRNQLCEPEGLSFDREGYLYVTDRKNHRVQRFSMEETS